MGVWQHPITGNPGLAGSRLALGIVAAAVHKIVVIFLDGVHVFETVGTGFDVGFNFHFSCTSL
jgi:hypothetical protein